MLMQALRNWLTAISWMFAMDLRRVFGQWSKSSDLPAKKGLGFLSSPRNQSFSSELPSTYHPLIAQIVNLEGRFW